MLRALAYFNQKKRAVCCAASHQLAAYQQQIRTTSAAWNNSTRLMELHYQPLGTMPKKTGSVAMQ